ncbi:(2Fe-2S)-binding protein [Mycobacterium alsense]|uniref:aromatic ring-hydroxylating oxygenase subunit alpha n=1 Tax=Mycobacterium alsense TaxID=324058 RepID=UPI000801E7BE|nr:aromatic ring-hydroxylating dioxygenase subunit alpha [Mycobacterium alsense]OBJ03954.1 (2Fe-2S)-binding protein [Mycobacterium alsense]
MSAARPGEWLDPASALGLSLEDIPPGTFNMTIPADRYTCPEYAARERKAIWMQAWQIAGRVEDLPKPGDWKKYEILDQSFIIVRGKDGGLRGFVNACRHRGNALCTTETGNARRGFLCQYHLWSYDLDGRLKGLLRESLAGPIDKKEKSLLQVSVDTFAGFIFLNPDPNATPLREYLGDEVIALLEPYHIDQFTTVMDVTEPIDCNWKVVMDAFEEGYHINGIHPQLLRVLHINPATARYRFFENHSVAMAPFEVAGASAEDQVEGMLALPETFPGTVAVIPHFQELLAPYRNDDGKVQFPDGITPRALLQQATREVLTGMGLDVGGLTDSQMVDNQGWVLFPNYFMTVRAGECHVVMSAPRPDGDPNRCVWHVASYMYVPEELRDAVRAEAIVVDTPGSYKYFEALQQDYEQMPRQQKGLRNDRLDHLTLVNEEVVIAHFHSVVDRYMAGAAKR